MRKNSKFVVELKKIEEQKKIMENLCGMFQIKVYSFKFSALSVMIRKQFILSKTDDWGLSN